MSWIFSATIFALRFFVSSCGHRDRLWPEGCHGCAQAWMLLPMPQRCGYIIRVCVRGSCVINSCHAFFPPQFSHFGFLSAAGQRDRLWPEGCHGCAQAWMLLPMPQRCGYFVCFCVRGSCVINSCHAIFPPQFSHFGFSQQLANVIGFGQKAAMDVRKHGCCFPCPKGVANSFRSACVAVV